MNINIITNNIKKRNSKMSLFLTNPPLSYLIFYEKKRAAVKPRTNIGLNFELLLLSQCLHNMEGCFSYRDLCNILC